MKSKAKNKQINLN